MITISGAELASLRPWFAREPLGPRRLLGQHVLATGVGVVRVDRWPDPELVLVDVVGNLALLGRSDGSLPESISSYVQGVLAASPAHEVALRATFPDLKVWDRVIQHLPGAPQEVVPHRGAVRPLRPDDAALVAGLSENVSWISKSWGGPAGLSGSGTAWGGFVDDRLVSVSCTFFLGDDEEDIGIVTEPAARGLGLGAASAAGVCRGIVERGRTPTWTTSPDNAGSLGVARKLGFIGAWTDVLYVINAEIPPVD
ncbi:GNAT family N-acetyltransferase [Tenggerimyces flavus]|uniref:GNAT family N-acetyltransferase n=1 Tax=Tenggerimyces flavus TaxID=1708749 RepID=A0ABV7YLD8_9ACTN|nr:GNAT family N-acetyltransferase [Tenggerimyces flavus]MBM7787669.1 RimJ/RimL family protein N-acetyltransferase [Tenggerimyces flavus]